MSRAASDEPHIPATSDGADAFRPVPRTGVIWVMNEAAAAGYRPDDGGWSNLGQGQPEAGALAGAPDRIEHFDVAGDDLEYAPVAGVPELREAVADHYNRLFRRGRGSKYSAENVCICAGGRLALTRVAASLGPIHLGHFLPDYTAYEELLEVFRLFTPIPILLDPDRGYDFSLAELRREILGRGLGALLFSNPCNPTGKLVGGEALSAWVATARALDCALIVDEFYSHYIWGEGSPSGLKKVTAAEYVDDVDRDPVVILDGLTKNWRYPGFRVAWTVGPKQVIERLASAGSFLDGGGPRPLQRRAVSLLDDDVTRGEIDAIGATFSRKRALMLGRLRELGVQIERPPDGTFYVWGDVSALPAPLDTDVGFFRAALQQKVICVPGSFFDVNPGKRRTAHGSRFRGHVRFSFGPDFDTVAAGLDRLADMVGGR